MLGAIIGDVIGSVWEFHPTTTGVNFDALKRECFFTDDSVLTLATADVLLYGGTFEDAYRYWGRQYPHRGYGGRFAWWLKNLDAGPYNSFGNGSAMRVSPVGWTFSTLEETLEVAKKSAECTHNHPEGVKGAQATAGLIFLARNGSDKDEMKRWVVSEFQYDLSRSIDEVRQTSVFDETCQISVPEAFIAFFDSNNYEETVRNAISLRADADTQACIAGGIAEAFWRNGPQGIPEEWISFTRNRFDPKCLAIIDDFIGKYVAK